MWFLMHASDIRYERLKLFLKPKTSAERTLELMVNYIVRSFTAQKQMENMGYSPSVLGVGIIGILKSNEEDVSYVFRWIR